MFALYAPVTATAQNLSLHEASDDSAISVTLVAPGGGAGRGRAVAEPMDLRRAIGANSVGVYLAHDAPGFHSTLVEKLHQAPRDGRGKEIALGARHSLLWRASDQDSARARVTPNLRGWFHGMCRT